MNNVILSAIKVEDYHARYFKNLGNRFRTFDMGMSWLFKALAEEGEKNKQELMIFGSRLMQANFNSYQAVHHGKEAFNYNKHFFVIDKEMALDLMEAAINIKYTHQLFYERCRSSEIDPLLRLFYKRLSLSEKQHTQVLEESMERFHTDMHLGIHPA